MAFIYILYLVVILLIVAVIYLIVDYYQVRKKLFQVPILLQRELDEKTEIQKNQQHKLSLLMKIQVNMEERVVQIDDYLKQLKDIPTETACDLQTVKMMELNTHFTIQQINKSMNFIQEMKSQQNK